MKILCIASVEDDKLIREQIAKQTMQPDEVYIHIDQNPAKGIDQRRKRIADNQRLLKAKVMATDYDLIWQLEGDGVLPENALQKLVQEYLVRDTKNFGYISGVEVGRHGLYCLGAWIFEDNEHFSSVDYRSKGVVRVDATGWYCLLSPRDVWLKGKIGWNDEVYGPDVVWGRSLREQGYDIYVDFDVKVGHKYKNGIIEVDNLSTCNARFYKEGNKWNYRQLN